jgi:diguanylate cyclase (GGDEF)-like protein
VNSRSKSASREPKVTNRIGGVQGLQQLLHSPTTEDATAPEIRARQFRACMQLIPFTAPSNCLFALFCTYLYWDVTPLWILLSCLSTVLVIETTSIIHWLYKRWPDRLIGHGDLFWVSLRASVLAIALIAPTVYWFPIGSADEQLMIASIVAALIGLGGFVLAPIVSAAIGWIFCATATASVALILAQRPVYLELMALLVVYGFVVAFVAVASSRTLVGRVVAETRAEQQHQVVELLLKDFEGSSRDWLWETDERGHLRHVSIRLTEAFARSKSSLEGVSLVDLIRSTFSSSGREAVEAHDFLQLRFSSRQAFRDQVIPVVIDSELRWWSLTAKPLFNARRIHVGWRGVGSDVTDAQRREIEMTHLANFDALTGLANRRQFRLSLDEALSEDSDVDAVMLLVLDLDNFKQINDTLGHLVGDELLREVARRLQLSTHDSELLARLGGDEYALIAKGRFQDEACLTRAQSLLNALREPFHVRDSRIEIRGSVGIALAPAHGNNSDELLKAADTALYAAKDGGRDGVRIFNAEMDVRTRRRLSIQSDLGRAIDNNELELHYQPQLDALTMQVVGFEALLRWRRSPEQLLSPAEFIPIAEETGLIVPIGEWVIQQACIDASSWPDAFFVAVNLSAVQFSSRGLIDSINKAVYDIGFDPVRLELEITESSLVEDSSHARVTLKTLRAFGHRIALDDFGTGYSSLAYLRSFPIDKLKIDRAFTVALDADETGDASAIVRAIIQLASALRLKTTAEGVETQEQFDALRAKGCSEVQGFLFAEPMPAKDIANFLLNWKFKQHEFDRTQKILA